MIFYCSWIDILNVLKWEWMLDKMTKNKNGQNNKKNKRVLNILKNTHHFLKFLKLDHIAKDPKIHP